jgi:hypothetical protein
VSDEKIVKLALKPTLPDEIKAAALDLIRQVLADVEAGNVTTVLVIAARPDGTWSREWSGTMEMAEMIGRLEITKQEWIAAYCKHYGGMPPCG